MTWHGLDHAASAASAMVACFSPACLFVAGLPACLLPGIGLVLPTIYPTAC